MLRFCGKTGVTVSLLLFIHLLGSAASDELATQNKSHQRGSNAQTRTHQNDVNQRLTLPLVYIDSLLPRQRLHFPSNDPMLGQLVNSQKEVVVFGSTPQGVPLSFGVIARLREVRPQEWELHGSRHVKLLAAAAEPDVHGITWGMVEPVVDAVDESDVESAHSLEILVRDWCKLVEGSRFERFSGQILNMFDDLGPMPPAREAGARALWVAALINPMPALGVAHEIRPAAISAASVPERLAIVTRGIQLSIGHVSGQSPLF